MMLMLADNTGPHPHPATCESILMGGGVGVRAAADFADPEGA